MSHDRQARIRALLFDRGQTSLSDLAEAVGASLPTLRRDLTEMEAAGLVERLHGSARIAEGARSETAFEAREQAGLAAKRAIAARAAEGLEEGQSVFLDAGTTVLQLARLFRLGTLRLNVFTNGLAVAQELAQTNHLSLTLIGGRFRPENLSTVGPLAEAMLEGLWFDHLFLGASALSEDGWITSHDAEEARLNARMIPRAKAVSVLTDASKFGTRATYAVHRLTGAERLVTDRAPEGLLAQVLTRIGTPVVVTEAAHG